MAKQRDEEWITVKEAALRVGVTPQAIRDGIKAGKYDGHKIKDHDGKREVYRVNAGTLPSAEVAKQSQTLPLDDEQLKVLVQGLADVLAPEVMTKVESVFQGMAEEITECRTLLTELQENTQVNKELQARVDEYERKSWWRLLFSRKE